MVSWRYFVNHKSFMIRLHGTIYELNCHELDEILDEILDEKLTNHQFVWEDATGNSFFLGHRCGHR